MLSFCWVHSDSVWTRSEAEQEGNGRATGPHPKFAPQISTSPASRERLSFRPHRYLDDRRLVPGGADEAQQVLRRHRVVRSLRKGWKFSGASASIPASSTSRTLPAASFITAKGVTEPA